MNNIIQDEELLARFIISKSWIRKSDNSIKPDAFIPYGNPPEVSVTCHDNLSENDLWDIGEDIVNNINEKYENITKKLYRRADILSMNIKIFKLSIRSDPTNSNPNHAVIENWLQFKSKDEYKQIALEIAKLSEFIPIP